MYCGTASAPTVTPGYSQTPITIPDLYLVSESVKNLWARFAGADQLCNLIARSAFGGRHISNASEIHKLQ